jgi:hypothetical protein
MLEYKIDVIAFMVLFIEHYRDKACRNKNKSGFQYNSTQRLALC